MKKIVPATSLTIILCGLSVMLSWPSLAYETKNIAVDPNNVWADNTKLGNMMTPDPNGSGELVPGAVDAAALTINLLLGLLGTLCLALIFYAGFKWIMAKGVEEEIAEAKEIISGTVLGLVVVLASYSFMYFMFRNIYNASK
ncbi:MAG: hypothetical protein WCW27_00105 [Patescibacteria group bacterium]|jgi:hypothetical protein